MGDLSEHFSRWEFACKCGCGADNPHPKLIEGLEELRELLNQAYPVVEEIKITVNSACRCVRHQRKIYRELGRLVNLKSQHLRSQGYRAADVYAWFRRRPVAKRLIDPVELARYASKIELFRVGGIGCYHWGCHLDVRGYPARWGLQWREESVF